jgi:uncharacterized membrane protein YgcG
VSLRVRSAVLGVAAGAALLVGAAAPALAAVGDQTSGREITRYDVTATLDADGTAHVTTDLDFDFGDDPGHGPYLTLVTRQRYDDTRDRLYQYSDISASSPSGAPAQVNRENDANAIVLRIGDPKVGDVSGVQRYVVTYTVKGWVNQANDQHSGDELNWNVIGSGWTVPLSRLSATVTGPATARDGLCFAGPHGSTTPCTSAKVAADGAPITPDQLAEGDEWTTVTGWPGGTFDAPPILGPTYDSTAPLNPAGVGGGVAGAVLLGGVGLAAVRVRRVGRDQEYLGLTPGLRPAGGQQALVWPRTRAAVTVQFAPPEGTRPGEVGTLVDEKADPVDVTATLVDLAVRGYLRIEEVPRENPKRKPKDWTLVLLRDPDDQLLAFERTLLDGVFAGRRQVTLSELRTTFAASMAAVQAGLYQHVTDNGWFRANPRSVRTAWRVAGVALVVAGIAITVPLVNARVQVRGVALIGVALALVGLVVAALGRTAPARTPDGTAVLAQTLGFRRYLATAEANQLKFEEGQDIFSRYLPYAIVFGLADRWARVFGELAASGAQVPQPGWYVGYYNPAAGLFWGQAFAGSMERFASVATDSLSAPTPGSSGGSGLGGGGFSGGGVGGGGGGGW